MVYRSGSRILGYLRPFRSGCARDGPVLGLERLVSEESLSTSGTVGRVDDRSARGFCFQTGRREPA